MQRTKIVGPTVLAVRGTGGRGAVLAATASASRRLTLVRGWGRDCWKCIYHGLPMPGMSSVVRVWAAVLARLGCVGCVMPRPVVVLLGCCRRAPVGMAVFLLCGFPFGIINENESGR